MAGKTMLKKISHDIKPGKLDRCQITGSKNLFEAIDLGYQPPPGALLKETDLHCPEVYYPLRLMISPESGLGQLDYILDGRILYPAEYPYRTGISVPLKIHLESFADKVISRFKVLPGTVCADIGSNDGTLLVAFKQRGMRTIGVEPTNMAKIAKKENEIETIQSFFTEAVAEDMIKEYGQIKIITMANVFAHMADLGEIMRGIRRLLDKRGIFITESQYLLDILERNQFDQVYHEHNRLYSVKSLVKLFPYYGMEVFDVERLLSREGSIRVFVAHKGAYPISPRVRELIRLEEEKELFEIKTWAKFRQRVEKNREKFLKLAHKAKEQGMHFVADSCPGRGTVLVNYYGLDKTLLPYIAQLPGTEKVGKYLPGTHTPIISNEIIVKDKPDYILILAWHFADYIIKNWRAKGIKSKFIIPLPDFKIID